MNPGILTRKFGMMMRHQAKVVPFKPAISPSIQGSVAYNLLTDEEKAQLKAALRDATKYYKCPATDLQWMFGKGSPVRPICIRKRKRIEL